ncbi:MAG: protein jag [Chloroflexi bacterium]|nr:protein jag [Chloroflexota bacterium]
MLPTSHEVTGKSVEDAIEKGLAQLGLPRDAVEIQIVREGSRGLLGIGAEEAIVRLTPLPSPEPQVVETPSAPPLAEAPAAEDVSPVGKQVLETLLHGMGIRSRVEIQRDLTPEDKKAFVLNIVGDDLGILIGRRGETLRDLEYITRLLVAQKTGKQAKLVVDVEGYRTRRERVLNELAKRMAERVQSNRQPITLEAMPPNERRIVHIALRDHPTVTTQSIGEGDHRRVMIIPK